MIPSSVKDITISQFMRCVDIYNTPGIDLLDREILILSELTGKPEEYFTSMDIGELKKLFRKVPILSIDGLKDVRFNKQLLLNGWLYKAVYDPSEVNVALYRDLKTYIDKGIDKNLHKILACIYRPVFRKYTSAEHKKTSELMLKQKIGNVTGAVFFYSDLLKRLNRPIQTYLKEKLTLIETSLRSELKSLKAL